MTLQFSFLRSVGIVTVISGMLATGCSDGASSDSSTLEKCVADKDCNQNRSCVNAQCVYPSSNINVGPDCVDNDQDKYGLNCPRGNDCNDANALISPAASEIPCNGIDENCNGVDYCPSRECVDLDEDGFGQFCEKGNDCDDADSSVNRKCLETMLKWRVSFGKVTAPAIGSDGTIYVGTNGGVKVLNPLNGEVIRDILLDCCFSCTDHNEQWFTPVLGNDGFLYGRCNNTISKVDVRRGEEVGRSRVYNGLYSGVGVLSLDSSGNLYFNAGAHNGGLLVALNPDLTERWRTPLVCIDGGLGSTSVGSDGTVYYNGCRHLRAFSPSGAELWNYLSEGSIERGIALSNTRAYISDQISLSAVNLQTGQKVWEHTSRAVFPPIIGPGNIIYGTEWLESTYTSSGNVFALDANGNLLWSHPVRSATQGTPAVTADGTIYTSGGNNSELSAFKSGEKLWSISIPGCSGAYAPLVVDTQGVIYAVGSSLCALQGDSPLADSPWPKQQHDLQNTGNKGR